MPDRHNPTSTIKKPGGNATTPCGQARDPLDVAGRINDLINCYLIAGGEYLKVYLPLAFVAVILLAVMLIAAREFIKE